MLYMTAVLENVNTFSYLGLRRRPTYNEVIGLIKENEALANPLPNRDATFFKASNEGSFFDGLDHLEVLKEQQQRILQRQVQDLLLRQNVRQNGGTYHLERHRQQSSSDTSSSSTPMSIGEDRGTLSVGLQADLQRRQQQLRDRQQQTGETHGEALSSQSRLPTLDSFLQGVTTPIRRMITPLPIPQRQPQTVDLTRGDEEDAQEQFFPEMMTARSNTEELIVNSLRFNNPNATDGEIKRVSNVLLKYSYLTPEQIAIDFNNFNILNEIYGALNRNGIISDDDMEKYQALTSEISDERKGKKRANLLRKLSEDYKAKIYDKYINNISNRPVEA